MNKNKYCCIIVTYNRAPDLTKLNKAISKGLIDGIIISDNSNNEVLIEAIKSQFKAEFRDKYIIIENHKNLGISRAMNIALKRALELGFNYAFLLDDDAQLSDDYFEIMEETMEKYKRTDQKIAAICPVVSNNPKHLSKIVRSHIIDYVKGCITSGMLIDIAIAVSLGGYSEKYFLEYADIELTYRLTSNGYKLLRYNKVLIYQQFGRNIESRLSRFLYSPLYFIHQYKFYANYFNDIIYYFQLYEPNRIRNIQNGLLKFYIQTERSKIKLLIRLSTAFVSLMYRNIALFILTKNKKYLRISWSHKYEVE